MFENYVWKSSLNNHNISKENKALISLIKSLIDSFFFFPKCAQNNDIS